MKGHSFVIDCFADSAFRYKNECAVVVVDVIRATTTAITAVSKGRRCYIATSIEGALSLAGGLKNPLFAGELGGNKPYGFDLNNSPTEIDQREDNERPLVLLSTSGTQLISNAGKCEVSYVACFRNYRAMTNHLINRHNHIALLGAGTRGEFREEDQMCCAWIGAELMNFYYEPEDSRTIDIVNRWRSEPVDACARGKSAEYLRNSGQQKDLTFILTHINDLDSVYSILDNQIVKISR